MAIRKGYRAVNEAAQKGGGRGESYRLVIKPGESALLRIYGDMEAEEVPVVADRHYVKRLESRDRYQMCGTNEDGHAGCVFCYAMDHKDRGISKSPISLFDVEDLRKFHPLDAPVRVLRPGVRLRPGQQGRKEDYEETKYPACKGLNCAFCKSGSDARTGGRRHWELAVMHADNVVARHEEARTFCKCGARTAEGGGTLYAASYACADCGADVDFDETSAVVKCPSCKRTGVPVEQLACTNEECPQPSRCSLYDFVVKVTRTGSDKTTVYNTELVHPCQPLDDDGLQAMKDGAIDLEALAAPLPSELQAKLLRIPCPFKTPGHGGVESRDLPEDDTDGAEYDETSDIPEDGEEEEEPARPALPNPRGAAPRPAAAAPPPRQAVRSAPVARQGAVLPRQGFGRASTAPTGLPTFGGKR